jgi:hypothetical protein
MMDHPTFRITPLTDAELRNPAADVRPGFRWWWLKGTSADQFVYELGAIADAGFSEVEIAFTDGFWGDDAQRDALTAVLQAATRRGIRVAMTMGAAWPLQTPNTTRGTEHAAQELQYGMVQLPAEPGTVVLPPALDDPDGVRGPRLGFATIARVIDSGDRPTVVPTKRYFHVEDIVHPPATSTVLAEDSLENVTEAVRDGRFHWTPREGTWVLLAFWVRDSLQGVASFLDGAAATAATEYLDEHQLGAENLRLLGAVGTDFFEDSLELNADSLFWAPRLLDAFIERHGYDPTPYLPLMYAHGMCRYWVPNEEPVPDFETESGIGRRVRRDYYRLLTDLYTTDHLLLLQRWSEGHGLRHKAQVAYGQNLEPVRTNRALAQAGGRVEGESLNSGDRAPMDSTHATWRFALDWQRAVVAGAHQGGTTRISTELGAQFQAAFDYTLGDLKQMLEKEWAAGITRPFVHGYASQPDAAEWPTHSRFWHLVADSWNDRTFPEWLNWRPLTDYWARGAAVLETGIPRTDVAILRDGFLTTAARGVFNGEADTGVPERLADTEPFERAGFTVQFVDPIGLAEQRTAPTAELYADGPAYRALIVTESAIPPETAEAIAAAAGRGLRVVFVGDLPAGDSGFGDPDGDARVTRAIAEALAHAQVARVEDMNAAAAWLSADGLHPRVRISGSVALTQWREAGSIRYITVYNPTSDPATLGLSLEGAGVVREVDLVEGEFRASPHLARADRTDVELDLRPLGFRVLELDLSAAPASRDSSERQATRTDVPLGSWALNVVTEEPGGSRVVSARVAEPGDWARHPELSTLSGVATYETTADLSRLDHAPDYFELELGDLAGSAVVTIGHRQWGPFFVSGESIRLSPDDLVDGRIRIEVRTTLRRAVAAAAISEHVTTATRPSGLIGPVRLRAAV